MPASPPIIDLRSDTVTRPGPGMREAMARAPVGDDQFGEDPAINALQARIAQLLGKPAALWLPSGTMANQVALKLYTQPGDDVIVNVQSHAIWHETGGSGANAGVQFSTIGDATGFTAEQFIAECKPRDHPLYPPTTLVEVENTLNRTGGGVVAHERSVQVCAAARERGVASYLDGARLWNAALVCERPVAELAAPFDLAMVSLSKGLGAPGGSMLAGSVVDIARAVRYRRMLGGAMRQVGIFAAAALYALDHQLARLADDHANARRVAAILAAGERIELDPADVQTNILVFRLRAGDPAFPDAHEVVLRARAQGVLVFAFDDRTIRAVTHLDVDTAQCEQAARVLVACADTPRH